jgi:hypothetical protein
MTPDKPWTRAVLWFLPILVWVGGLVYAAHDIDAQRQSMRNESYAPGQNLAACLDFALDEYTTPSATKRAACVARQTDDEARVASEKGAHEKRIRLDVVALLALAALMATYFALVPRRFRAGFRVWIFVVIGGVVCTTLALLLVLSGMPHGD